MRVWLHEWKGNEWGWDAWSLDHLGLATWAPTKEEALLRIPGKYEEYQRWLARHQGAPRTVAPSSITVVEEISGNEVAFTDDLVPATCEQISRCLAFLTFSRQDLLAIVNRLPDSLLDWDPPYRHFAEWANWRTIRQILAHIAATEVSYYLPAIGYLGSLRLAEESWRDQLRKSRQETERFLLELVDSPEKGRITTSTEVWSVRKVLRRLVRHELLHWKSINRIVREYERISQ